MCGIAGIVGPDAASLRPIAAMTRALQHRGPDDEGYLLADTRQGRAASFRGAQTVPSIPDPPLPAVLPEGTNLALGHRRLAIIDLTPAGHGPMASPDGRFWITYNGEIYNYVELRDELRALGHRFTTATDTEVLLASYAQWGRECLPRFNGMWAFALYDARENLVFCARDRFGVKPFHYYASDDFFAFASEIKGLLAHPRIPRRAHEATLHGFLVGGALDEGDQTFFDGIRRLSGGHELALDIGTLRMRIRPWYRLPETGLPPDPPQFARLLEDAVRLRLRSDVDVGTCLSGGLDSSSIVCLTARLRGPSARGLHRSFSVIYPDADINEESFVNEVVAATGVGGVHTTPTSGGLLADFPALVRHQDEPFSSAGPYSQWCVMQLAKKARVPVLLDGQGADEVLGGYHYHYGPYLAEIAQARGLVAAIREARLASRVTRRPLSFFLGLLAYHALPLPRTLREYAVAREVSQSRIPPGLIEPSFAARAGPTSSERHQPRRSLAEERRANILRTSLPALLRYEDRSSMAFSVEARTPFLDYRLVEASLALPAGELIQEGWTKSILRRGMEGILPEGVRLRRDKLGYATPQTRFVQELAPQIREWLGPRARIAPLLNKKALSPWLSGPDWALARQSGLWRLLSLELWHRYLEERAA